MRNLIIKTCLAAIVVAAPNLARAQQDPMISQHMFNGHFINPAYVGSHDYANITALGRKQWVSLDGAPFTTFLSFDMPIQKKNFAVGGIVADDRIGVTERMQISGTFAYHIALGEKLKLSAGIRAGGELYRAKLTDLTYWDQNDVVFANNVNGKFLPVAGLGIYLYSKRFYAGASIPNVISYEEGTAVAINNGSDPNLERHYLATAGYAIPAGKNLDIKPSILMKYVTGAPLEMDYSLNLFFYKTLWIGGTYRSGDGIVAMTEYQATKNLRIGYAYDLTLTHLKSYNSGSHELMIAWDFVKDEQVRYRSPRFF